MSNLIQEKIDSIKNEDKFEGISPEIISEPLTLLNRDKVSKIEIDNMARIDKGGLVGNSYTKEQTLSEISKSFIGSIKSEAIPSTIPTPYTPITHPNGLYEKYDVKTAGTYTNFKNASNVAIIITAEDLDKNQVQIWINNGVAKKIITELPIITAKSIFDPTDNVNAPTIKAIADRYDNANDVLKYFVQSAATSSNVTGFLSNLYLRRDGGTLSSNGNKTLLNIDVSDCVGLIYDCFPAVITAALDSQYCAILGEKADGTKVVLRTSSLVGDVGQGQSRVNEEYDISDYVKLSVSIGDLTTSENQVPQIQLLKGSSDAGLDAVKRYIDKKNNDSAASVGNIKKSLKYFVELGSDSRKITDFLANLYLRRDGGTLSSNGNKTILNIDVTNFSKIKYDCFPAVITAALDSQYCAILGEKADGTKVVLRTSSLVGDVGQGQSRVNEEYDISDYVKLSVSIGDLTTSENQVPNIVLYRTEALDLENSVKDYIDKKADGNDSKKIILKGNLSLNKIDAFSAPNVTLVGATISAGVITCVGNSSATIKESTLNENSDMNFIYKENSSSSVMAGFRSYNPFGYGHNTFIKYHTSGANIGRLEIIAGTSLGFSKISTNANANYNLGDLLKIGIIRQGLKYIFYVQNLSKSWKIEMTQIVTPLGFPFVAHNSANPQFICTSGNVSVYQYSHTSFSASIDNAINGDSITFGQSATSEVNRWATLVNGNNIVMGGGADVTSSVLARVSEIIKINPRRVILMIGGNDILFNVPPATWQQNLKNIRNQLVMAGIEVVHCYPTPRTGAAQLITFLKNEPTFILDSKIDTNTLLMNGNADTLKPEYDGGDHLHPSDLGMAKVAEIINAFLI